METLAALLLIMTLLVWFLAGLLVLKIIRRFWRFVVYGLSFRVIVRAVQRRYQ